MKTGLFVTFVILGLALGAGNAAVLIDGTSGNGDFEATEPVSGGQDHAATPHWHNVSGPETGVDFTRDSGTAGSPQKRSRAAIPSLGKSVNDVGYAVRSADEIFNISVHVHQYGGGFGGDEYLRVFLFSAAAPVDHDLAETQITELGEVWFPIDGGWVSKSGPVAYATSPEDVGRTVYLGMQLVNPAGPGVFPRVDLLRCEVAKGSPEVISSLQDYKPASITAQKDDRSPADLALPPLYDPARIRSSPKVVSAHRASRPNIVMIMCDDLGYADVGFNAAHFGVSSDIATPHIDTLAAEGMIFSQAYVPHPFCGPSRMGMITGRYPHHFGGSRNLPNETLNLFDWNETGGTPVSETTLSTLLQHAGYHTGAIGKWHMGLGPDFHPNNRGFAHWYGFLGGGHNYFPYRTDPVHPKISDYQFFLTRNGDEVSSPEGGYLTDLLSKDAANFVSQAPTNQPFFLYLAYNAPHSPMQGKPDDLRALYEGSGDYDDYSDRQNLVAMMVAVDRGVSNVVHALTEKGVIEDTLIVFLSDNGGKLSDEANNGPLRGGKGNTLEGGIRTPMFIHYPKAIPAGSVYEHVFLAYDFYPTFAALADATIPQGKILSGKNVWADVRANRNPHRAAMLWVRHNGGGNQVGIRKGDYKAHRLNFSNWKLFDVAADLREANDISRGNAAILNDLISDGLRWSNDGVDPLWHDTLSSYGRWTNNGMPRYSQTFSE